MLREHVKAYSVGTCSMHECDEKYIQSFSGHI